jgi:hypothetical protein
MPRYAPIACAVLLSVAPFGLARASAADTPTDTSVPTSVVSPDSTFVYDLVNEPSQCINNSNPRPNCGRKPQSSGDRGGWMQYTVFFVMLGAVGFIGTVIGRNVVRRDKAIAEQYADKK